ncbi:MAG: glutamate synthase large subunit [Ilumatobacter sp.]|uniref:glutamate synthase large subunit n=1 Tax=Ilumatobacter sp. TaxID=1967498 RepID=UPI00262B0C35|nr:glutamate synthase large subunit [Ilumatobacter sp.]MDJ0768057.1 glutamate synthase large subunit [Ilumatobacter sp.]
MPTNPRATGLYDPRFEHDSCGVSFVAHMKGERSNQLVQTGLRALTNLEHRGATGAEPDTGDGAGILIQVPDRLLRATVEFELPAAGSYAAGIVFLPAEDPVREKAQGQIDAIMAEEGLTVLGWRDVPIDPSCLGKTSRAAMPSFRQLFVSSPNGESGLALDRRTFVARKRTEHELTGELDSYFASLSARTMVYKGMLTTPQLSAFFLDLTDERIESALLLVHSRFSTNTFPSWPLAHPYRYVAHNGEINTVQGNQNWMRAREAMAESPHLDNLERAFPICTPGASDTARFDEALELLHLGGRPLHHAVLMMIPEAWENADEMDDDRRAFYRFHASVMEPWDGPASVTFTDGEVIGAVLDRNGLRPSRYWVTDDDLVIMASEVGVIEVEPAKVVSKGRLQPGKMFLIDTREGRIVDDEEIKKQLAAEHPYGEWVEQGIVELDDLPEREHVVFSHDSVLRRQQMFGYTHEELKIIVAPMARDGKEPIGSMGTDTPIAVLSERPRLLFDYFAQLFAQVTNPPLDAIREEVVTAVASTIGPEANLLAPGPESCRQLALPFPIIDNDELAKIIHANDDGQFPGLTAWVVRGLYRVDGGGDALARALDAIFREVSTAIEQGARVIVLSDRNADSVDAPIPSLLLTSAVHHHLVRTKQRTKVGLVVECGDAREVHHMALLIGYGAGAINPYLAFESIEDLISEGLHGMRGLDPQQAIKSYIKACGKGVLKVMSKIGISTVASYTGAQIFEAIGLGDELVDKYFTGTVSRLGGVGLDELAAAIKMRHSVANPARPEGRAHRKLELGGEYQWRREGEYHLFNPETVFKLQHATRAGRYDVFKEYSERVDDQSRNLATLRGLFQFKDPATVGRGPVPIEEVEPVSEIVKRFSTGAMSYGSISAEAHETLAKAMNQLGAKSNTGEGGEDPDRLYDPTRRSSIKQVASGRFGVTAEYLTNSDDIQIKMAQGAKPGEGGQLPGGKVYPWIAKTRHSTPGVGLISPPPHHDIYSIEDIKQLIHDLKNANPEARVHVKLVAQMGVGTVAAGVSKAKADVVLISGHDGGTGASPLTSLKHAGGPWELGLAETQQTLLLNGLRDRIVVQTDGQLKTGRDVVIAALLGAEEYGFATAPLVVSGCVMMRVCHLDTCPVGVATQNPELRKRFNGAPEFVVNFFEYVAEEIREYMAELGFRTMDEMIGHVEALDVKPAVDHWKAHGLDISPILEVVDNPYDQAFHCTADQDHGLDEALDQELIRLAQPAITNGERVDIALPIRNVNRTVGTLLGHEVTKAHRGAGLPDGTINIEFDGSAGQSFGAFVPSGITMRLNGDANDYLGKGLSGGRLIVRPPAASPFVAEDQIIAGNVIAYGATAGEIYLRGIVGERFCVRNSGVTAVVEGVGDHGCEYMTGGRVVVLGPTGRNFGAGMSGGIAYVYDPGGDFDRKVNYEMVEVEQLDDEDREFLRSTIEAHHTYTDSAVAKGMLASWSVDVSRFRKVMPVDYKRVLTVMAESEAAGLSESETVDRVMEAARG